MLRQMQDHTTECLQARKCRGVMVIGSAAMMQGVLCTWQCKDWQRFSRPAAHLRMSRWQALEMGSSARCQEGQVGRASAPLHQAGRQTVGCLGAGWDLQRMSTGQTGGLHACCTADRRRGVGPKRYAAASTDDLCAMQQADG